MPFFFFINSTTFFFFIQETCFVEVFIGFLYHCLNWYVILIFRNKKGSLRLYEEKVVVAGRFALIGSLLCSSLSFGIFFSADISLLLRIRHAAFLLYKRDVRKPLFKNESGQTGPEACCSSSCSSRDNFSRKYSLCCL